mmetsp:Transcript_25493/g.66173  ORF Transcript_25493/g.66173 Transcript_25493/m.66173 type:complete len:351 (-) Transcript_25493:353-1405(-)
MEEGSPLGWMDAQGWVSRSAFHLEPERKRKRDQQHAQEGAVARSTAVRVVRNTWQSHVGHLGHADIHDLLHGGGHDVAALDAGASVACGERSVVAAKAEVISAVVQHPGAVHHTVRAPQVDVLHGDGAVDHAGRIALDVAEVAHVPGGQWLGGVAVGGADRVVVAAGDVRAAAEGVRRRVAVDVPSMGRLRTNAGRQGHDSQGAGRLLHHERCDGDVCGAGGEVGHCVQRGELEDLAAPQAAAGIASGKGAIVASQAKIILIGVDHKRARHRHLGLKQVGIQIIGDGHVEDGHAILVRLDVAKVAEVLVGVGVVRRAVGGGVGVPVATGGGAAVGEVSRVVDVEPVQAGA